MKRILSVSLGSSRRDKVTRTAFLGQQFQLERRGTDGSLKKMAETMQAADGQVDVITLGAVHIHLVLLNGVRLPFRDAARLKELVNKTPVVDGEQFRELVEPLFLRRVFQQGIVDNSQSVLFPLVSNRLALASQFEQLGFTDISYGDLIYDIGFPPIVVHCLKTYHVLARIVGPVATRVPYQWIYPTGEKQNTIQPRKPGLFRKADIIAGDFHNIRRYLVVGLSNKTIITNTVTSDDRDLLAKRGLKYLVTFSPNYGGRTFGSNVLNGVVVSLLGKQPDEIRSEEYLATIDEMGLQPNVEQLN